MRSRSLVLFAASFLVATAQPIAAQTVHAIDFVRTLPGEQADYLRFIELNWAAARAAAQ